MPRNSLKRNIRYVPIIIDEILSGKNVYGRWMDDLTLQRFDQEYREYHDQIIGSGLRVVEVALLGGELLEGELLEAKRSGAPTGSFALHIGNHWVYMHIQFDATPVNITIYDSRRAGSIRMIPMQYLKRSLIRCTTGMDPPKFSNTCYNPTVFLK